MKIHLLSFTSPKKSIDDAITSIKMLNEAAQKQGHSLEVIYAKDCQLSFVKKPKFLVKNKIPKGVRVLIVKAGFGAADLDFHVTTIKQAEGLGVPVINRHGPVIRAKNKIRTLQKLQNKNIPVPKSYVVRSAEYIEDMVEKIGRYPVILKVATGSFGIGVSIVESKRGLRSMIDLLVNNENVPPIIVQEYVRGSRGRDLRVFVVGGKIIAAMERVAQKKGEFRANFSLGGKVKIAELTKKERRIALAAAKVIGLDIAGVDLIRGVNSDGEVDPKVLEVNANPGLDGITEATGIDVAGAIIKYAVKRAGEGE